MADATSPLAATGPGLTDLLQVVGGLLLLLGLLYVGFYLLRKYGHKAGLGSAAKGRLKLEGGLSLGPKRSLVLVRFLNKHLLLGVTDHSITLLTEAEADHDDGHQTFSGALTKARDDSGGE